MKKIALFMERYGRHLSLALGLGFSVVLVQYRYMQTGVPIFRFFWWNLLLAVIPWVCSVSLQGSFWRVLPRVCLAVLFLPNAPYMVTDLFHLRTRAEFPLWYDTMVIFWFAAVGIVLFYLTLANLEKWLRRYAGALATQLAVAFVCFLNGFGIYLGRYLRFNSWDILSNSDDLAEQILDRLINPSDHTRTVGVTLLYGLALLVGHWMVKLFTFKRSV